MGWDGLNMCFVSLHRIWNGLGYLSCEPYEIINRFNLSYLTRSGEAQCVLIIRRVFNIVIFDMHWYPNKKFSKNDLFATT